MAGTVRTREQLTTAPGAPFRTGAVPVNGDFQDLSASHFNLLDDDASRVTVDPVSHVFLAAELGVLPLEAGGPRALLAGVINKIVSLLPFTVRTVDTIAELRALPGDTRRAVYVRGYWAPGDDGGGIFRFDSARVAEDDGGLCVLGWVRKIGDAVLPQMYGAVGDGVADDTAPVQKAIDAAALPTTGTKTVRFLAGTYLLSAPLNMTRGDLPAGAVSRGDIELVGQGLFFSATLLGQTGNSKSIIDVSCTTNFRIKALALKAGDVNPSGIGILALGGQSLGTGFCGSSMIEDVFILLKEDMTANGGLGTVGLYLGSCEEAIWCKVHSQAVLPLYITANMSTSLCVGWVSKFLSDYVTTDDNFSCGVNQFDRLSLVGLGRERPLMFAQGVNVLHINNAYFARLGSTSGTYGNSVTLAGGVVNFELSGGVETGCLPLFDNRGTVSNAEVRLRVASSSTLYVKNADDPVFMSNSQQQNYGGAWINSEIAISLAPEIPHTVRLFACDIGAVSAEPKPAMLRNTKLSISKSLFDYQNLKIDKSMLVKSHDSEIKYNDVTLKLAGTKQQSVELSGVPLCRAVASTTLWSQIGTIEMQDYSSATNANAVSIVLAIRGAVLSAAFPFRATAGQFTASAGAVDGMLALVSSNSGALPRMTPATLTAFNTALPATVSNSNSGTLGIASVATAALAVGLRGNSTTYVVGENILVVLGSGKVILCECTTGGTTAASPPTFASTKGATTADGGVVWTVTRGVWASGISYAAGDTISVMMNGLPYFMKVNIGGTAGASEPVWSLGTFDFLEASGLRWLHGGMASPTWHIMLFAGFAVNAASLTDMQFAGRITADICGARESSPLLLPAWAWLPDTLQSSI